jgi:hypothetical protein
MRKCHLWVRANGRAIILSINIHRTSTSGPVDLERAAGGRRHIFGDALSRECIREAGHEREE